MLSPALPPLQVAGVSGATTGLCLLDRNPRMVESLRGSWVNELRPVSESQWLAGVPVRAGGVDKPLLDHLVMTPLHAQEG
eukprot:scaffold243489_cov21-Tisochrysis_lutea.AAC.1